VLGDGRVVVPFREKHEISILSIETKPGVGQSTLTDDRKRGQLLGGNKCGA